MSARGEQVRGCRFWIGVSLVSPQSFSLPPFFPFVFLFCYLCDFFCTWRNKSGPTKSRVLMDNWSEGAGKNVEFTKMRWLDSHITFQDFGCSPAL